MGPLLVVVFLFVPIAEIYVIIQVGQVIGPLPTVALLIVESLLGAWLLKREGRTAWASLQAAVASGRLPARELVDAGLVLVGGTLLLTPGFLTDIVGFFFILPPTRPIARRLLSWLLVRRAARVALGRRAWGAQGPLRRATATYPPTGKAGPPQVIPGELVTDVDAQEPPDDKGPGRAAGG